MERECYAKIIQVNLKHNFIYPFLATVFIGVFAAMLFNLKALPAVAALQPIELLMCFTGVMMMTPVFLPEQNPDIKDVICSKWVDYTKVCLIRFAYSIVSVVIVNIIFVLAMKVQESEISGFHIFAAIAGALFLGAIGFFVSGITGNATAGYMVAMGYYLINYGAKKKLGVFNMFSGSVEAFEDKAWLVLWAAALVTITFVWMKIRTKR